MARTHLIIGAMLLEQSLCAGTAAAVVITLQPASNTVVVGERFDVSVAISDLGDFAPPSLGIVDLEIGFESDSVSIISAESGDPVLGDQLDLLGIGSSTEATASASTVNLFGLSLDLPEDLIALRSAQFVFAMIVLGIAVGSRVVMRHAPLHASAVARPCTAK